MYERFTERSRQVLVLAHDAARQLDHSYIGTEHILLGFMRESESNGATILRLFQVTADKVRDEVMRELSGKGRQQKVSQANRTNLSAMVAKMLEDISGVKVARDVLDESELERIANLAMSHAATPGLTLQWKTAYAALADAASELMQMHEPAETT